MKLNWQGNTRVTIGGTTKTPQGRPPALHLFRFNLYMVYVGQSGENLYYSWLEPGNLAGEWQGNIKISIDNKTVHSAGAPALCVVSDILHMVYSGPDGDSLFWSWFDGATWYGNIEILNQDQLNKPIPNARPALAVKIEGDALQLVYTNKAGDLYYSSCDVGDWDPATPWSAAVWSRATLVAAPAPVVGALGYASPAIAPISAGFAVAACVGEALVIGVGPPPSPTISWNFGAVTTPNPQNSPLVTFGPTMVSWNDTLYLVYVGHSGKYLWYCALDAHGALLDNWQITTGSTPETASPPAAAVFDEQLCIAYTGSGHGSDNLYFAYTDNFPPLTVPFNGHPHPF